jgi:hypothetical protein
MTCYAFGDLLGYTLDRAIGGLPRVRGSSLEAGSFEHAFWPQCIIGTQIYGRNFGAPRIGLNR